MIIRLTWGPGIDLSVKLLSLLASKMGAASWRGLPGEKRFSSRVLHIKAHSSQVKLDSWREVNVGWCGVQSSRSEGVALSKRMLLRVHGDICWHSEQRAIERGWL